MTTHEPTGVGSELSERRIPDLTLQEGEKPEAGIWDYAGEAPGSRLIGGALAAGKHGTCTSCWWPMPEGALVGGECPDCRGEGGYQAAYEPPSKEDYL